jgi:hypothetical protein
VATRATSSTFPYDSDGSWFPAAARVRRSPWRWLQATGHQDMGKFTGRGGAQYAHGHPVRQVINPD